MIHAVSKVKKRGVDLNLKLVQSSIFTSEDGNEYRKDPVRPTHGLPAMDHVHSHSRPLRRQPPGADFPVRRTVPGDGLCSTDLPGKPARHRSLPLGAIAQALPHGLPRASAALDPGRCQRVPRLAHLRRICPAAHRTGAEALRPRGLGAGTGQHGLRARLDDHRPVPVGVPLGAVPHHQVGGEDAHLA